MLCQKNDTTLPWHCQDICNSKSEIVIFAKMLKIPVLKRLCAYKIPSKHWNTPSWGSKERMYSGPSPNTPRPFPWKLEITYFNPQNLLFHSVENRAPEHAASCEPHVARVRWKFPLSVQKAVVSVGRAEDAVQQHCHCHSNSARELMMIRLSEPALLSSIWSSNFCLAEKDTKSEVFELSQES